MSWQPNVSELHEKIIASARSAGVAQSTIDSFDFSTLSKVDKFGVNPDVDTGSVPETVWPLGGAYSGFLSAASNLEVVSSSPSDAGKPVTISNLLDSNYDEVADQVVTLNGTSPVAIPGGPYLRCTRAYMSGTRAQTNTGNITVRVASGGSVMSYISSGDGQTLQSTLTVPNDKLLFVSNIQIAMVRANGSAGSSTVRLLVGEENKPFLTKRDVEISNSFPYVYKNGFLFFDSRTDIELRSVFTSDNNTIISGEINGYYLSI